MVDALIVELNMRKAYTQNDGTLRTLYLGGGTPSLLEEAQVSRLFSAIFQHFSLEEGAEVTLEANPEDITAEKVAHWASLGINRLSIGIQSFSQDDLSWMNRAHSLEEAARCVELARKGGIPAASVDLIFGLPGMDLEAWENNLLKALALSPDHFSLYAL